MTKWLAVLTVVVAVGAAGRAAVAQDASSDIDAVCPCDATADGAVWTSHAAYLACVATEARQRRVDGGMRARQVRAAIRAAKAASCGNPLLTRCCIYRSDEDEVGRCRLMPIEGCEALDDRMEDGEADDEGSGSCLPNPCAF